VIVYEHERTAFCDVRGEPAQGCRHLIYKQLLLHPGICHRFISWPGPMRVTVQVAFQSVYEWQIDDIHGWYPTILVSTRSPPRAETLTYEALVFWASFFSNFFFASSCFKAAFFKRCAFRRPFPRFGPTTLTGFSYNFFRRAASSSARCFSFFLSRFFRAVKDCFSKAP